jgi:hypothetical protein
MALSPPQGWRARASGDAPGRPEYAAEFLRRNGRFRAEQAQMVRGIADGTLDEDAAQAAFARQWGCMDAGASVEIAAPQCWQPELVPITVILDTAPEAFPDAQAVDPDAIGAPMAKASGEGGRHVVIADPDGEHRLWLRDDTPGKAMAAVIPLDRNFHMRVASLMRFHRRLLGRSSCAQPRGWVLTPYRRKRFDLMLRAFDMREAGASYRDIAAALGEHDAAQLPATEWKDSRARSYVIRLVRAATAMTNGGYRKLLSIR